jgi:hypothetical protein
MRVIHTREEFRDLATRLGVRADWHEPDEQDVSARVEGESFDNAGFWPQSTTRPIPAEILEMHVVITCDGEDAAVVNLANLCAWASEPSPAAAIAATVDMYEETVESIVRIRN